MAWIRYSLWDAHIPEFFHYRSFCSLDETAECLYDWYFGLFNDNNNIEDLSLICLQYAMEGIGDEDIARIGEKFKKLKKCHISLHAEDEVDRMPSLYKTCEKYVSAFAKSLDENFNDRPTKFEVFIRYGDDKKQFYQITKMPFQNSVIKKLKWSECDEPCTYWKKKNIEMLQC